MRTRKVRILGQVLFLSGQNVWRVLWDEGGYRDCKLTSLDYDRFGTNLVTMISGDGGQVTDYSTDICPNSDYYSTYF